MSRSNPQQILNNLALSPNSFAAGIALCVKALNEATAGPPTSPIVVDYRNRRMAFGRRHLARLGGHVSSIRARLSFSQLTGQQEAIRMAVRTIYPHGHIPDTQRFIVEARLFGDDGQPARRDVGIDLESWEELVPYIQILFVANEPVVSPRDRDRDREREREPQRERERDRPRRGSFSVPNPGLEVRSTLVIWTTRCSNNRARGETIPESGSVSVMNYTQRLAGESKYVIPHLLSPYYT